MEHRTPIETEIKLRLPDLQGLQSRLESLGFRLTSPEQAETSVLWDRKGELRGQGSALRLRRFDGRAWFTWKGPRLQDAAFKIRPELETEVSDPEALEGILRALGFEPVMRMEKTRAVLRNPELVACLDRTPFGCFLELEGEPSAIRSAMEALGLGAELAETRSYPELFREHHLA